MKISFFASAVKYERWEKLLNSLKSNKIEYEVVFAGYLESDDIVRILKKYPELRYITTQNIKISQCYEVARRVCHGELVCWIDDDHVFSEGFADKVYEYWLTLNNPKVIIATQYVEKNTPENIEQYRFFPRNVNTPQMANCGIMSRTYLEELGGLDSRYIIARWNCDICMRALADGGKVEVFKDVCVTLDSNNKNGLANNYWSGWNEDSEQLENSWVIGGYKRYADPFMLREKDGNIIWYIPLENREVTLNRNDKFVPFKKDGLTLNSQYPYGFWFPTQMPEENNG